MEGKMRILLTIAVSLILTAGAYGQFNDFDNVPYSEGFYLQAYPGFSTASKAFNQDGDSYDYSESWSRVGFAARPAYYGMVGENRWMVSAFLPFVSNNPPAGDSEAGVGDVQLSAAYWLIDQHKDGMYLSFWVWADVPTGDDEKFLGNGQMNIRPGVAFAKESQQWRGQASIYYNLRMKNSDTEVKPGDEIWANANFGYWVSPQAMPGLELQTGFGQDGSWNDIDIPESGQQWFRVGPYVEYQVNPQIGLKVSGLYNVMGKNNPQSIDIGARLTWGF